MAERQYLTPLGRPATVKEFDGLKTITRRYKVQGEAVREVNVDTEVFLPYGTADEEYPLALLVQRSMEPLASQPSSLDQQLVETYREFTPGEKVQVGENMVSRDDSGRETLTIKYVALATESEALAQDIGVVLDGKACAGVQIQKQGVGAQIIETYIESGKISENTTISNNGALTIKTLVYFNEVPPTPAGFVLVSTSVQNSEGVPTYSYQFAKGSGRVSTQVETRNNGKVTVTTIRYMGADSEATPAGALLSTDTLQQDGYVVTTKQFVTGSGRIATNISHKQKGKLKITRITYIGADDGVTPTGTLIEQNSQTSDGYTIYSDSYSEVVGDGLVEDIVETKYNGKLILYRRVSLGTIPTAPAATIGGTVVLVSTSVRQEEGYTLYDYQWAEGNGLISERIDMKESGLRVQTYVSLGIKSTPDGVVTSDDVDQVDGVARYTVSAVQSLTGGSPTGSPYSFEKYVQFLYPGRAMAYSKAVTVSGGGTATLLNVFESPPIETEVLATISISYQTSNTLGSVPYTKWQPKEWATARANWIGYNNVANSQVTGLRGFRSVSETPVTYTQPIIASGTGGSINGKGIYGGTTAELDVTGGPPDPGGNTYVLDANLDPAFTSTAGVVYYRKTVVYATIPVQAAIPTL